MKYLQDKNLTFTSPPTDDEDEDLPNLVPRSKSMPLIDPSDIVGRSLLCTDDDGKCLRVSISRALEDCENELDKDLAQREFACTTCDD